MRTNRYVFLNACDGSALEFPDALPRFEDGCLTPSEAQERVLELAEQHPDYLIGAYRVEEEFVAQRAGGHFVDRDGVRLYNSRLAKEPSR